jgi:cell division protein FtsQ
VPVAFDEEGVVFQVGRGVTVLDLPILSGLSFSPVMGIDLPALLDPLLADMVRLREESPEMYRLISEIRVQAVGEADYEAILYPADYGVRVLLGRRLDATFLRYVFMVLDVLEKEGVTSRVREIDLRTGTVVYSDIGRQGEE